MPPIREVFRSVAVALALLTPVLIGGCGGGDRPAAVVEVPAYYVGEWTAPGVRLLLTASGQFEYSRHRDSGATFDLSGPLSEFTPKRFAFGIGPLAVRFPIDAAPVRDGLVWRMTVDGVELIRPVQTEPLGPAT